MSAKFRATEIKEISDLPPYSPFQPAYEEAQIPATKQQGFCQRHLKSIIIVSTVASVLFALGISGFFLYPRIPIVQFKSFDFVKGAHVQITSQNYIDITVNDLEGVVEHKNEKVVSFHTGLFVIKGHDVTDLYIPLQIHSTKAVLATGKTNSTITGILKAEIDLKLLSWTGYKIPIKTTLSVPSPNINNNIQGNQPHDSNDMEIIKKEFQEETGYDFDQARAMAQGHSKSEIDEAIEQASEEEIQRYTGLSKSEARIVWEKYRKYL